MSSRTLNEVARQIRESHSTKVDAIGLRQGVVQSLNVGPPVSVNVRISGSAVTVHNLRYLASYTPVVDDVVFMLSVGSTLLVLGDLA